MRLEPPLAGMIPKTLGDKRVFSDEQMQLPCHSA
jgi:hypothetical protein